MNKLFAIAALLIALGVGAFVYIRSQKSPAPVPNSEPATEAAPTAPPAQTAPSAVAEETKPAPAPTQHLPKPVAPAQPPAPENLNDPDVLKQSIAIMVSPQSTFAQKQAEWKKWREAGKLDDVIKELKQQAAENPKDAAYPAALGQAYIYEIAGTKDMRDQAMLGMQADKSFEAALDLDPNNWDARFFKTAAMSHWPAELNKGPEVIANFTKLIEQQEAMPNSQPQFAQSYIRLGEAYEKAGQLDNAKQVWQRGAALFPDNSALKEKLNPPRTSTY